MNEELIRELAEKLGTTTEYLWASLVNQAFVSSVTSVIIYGIWAVVLLVAVPWLKKAWNWAGEEVSHGEAEFRGTVLIASFCVWVVTASLWFIGFLVNAKTIISGFVNPEYWALQELLRLL
jgi:hypothetical protein